LTASQLKSLQGILFILLLIAGFAAFAVIVASDPQFPNFFGRRIPPVGYVEVYAGRIAGFIFVKAWAGHVLTLISVAIVAISALVLVISRAIKRRDALDPDRF